jgi:hypothetical protein
MFKACLIGFSLLIAAGCSSSTDAGLSRTNADVVGTITQVTVAADGSGQVRLLIQNLTRTPDGSTLQGLFMTVNPSTPVTFSNGTTASLSDLKAGVVIYANVDPVVVDTFPPQYTATEVKIPIQA